MVTESDVEATVAATFTDQRVHRFGGRVVNHGQLLLFSFKGCLVEYLYGRRPDPYAAAEFERYFDAVFFKEILFFSFQFFRDQTYFCLTI